MRYDGLRKEIIQYILVYLVYRHHELCLFQDHYNIDGLASPVVPNIFFPAGWQSRKRAMGSCSRRARSPPEFRLAVNLNWCILIVSFLISSLIIHVRNDVAPDCPLGFHPNNHEPRA
jgi:hypothetical protein